MPDGRTAQERQRRKRMYQRRRMGALAIAVLLVVLISVVIISSIGKKNKVGDIVVIGPSVPANVLDIEPLYALYDYSKPVAESPSAENWFGDALLVGDSRVDGLKIYNLIPSADVASGSLVSVVNVLEKTFTVGASETTLSALLGSKTYGKIYIQIGINEVSWLSAADFKASYGTLIDTIKQAQPAAAIYTQSLIPASAAKGWNDSIAAYNSAIKDIALQKSVYYIDVYSAYADESGSLPAADDGGDGVNLSVDSYTIWLNYLKTHTVNREMYKN